MRFWIDNHGCAKNQVDGEEILARLEGAGHMWVDGPEEADLIIVNTCGFIEEAKKESIGAVIALKASHPHARILVAGCLSQRYANELAEGLPEADGLVGNADLVTVLKAAEETERGNRPVLIPGVGSGQSVSSIGAVRRGRLFDYPGTAHVKITEGCSNHCSFCAIPIIRGELRSRQADDVIAECRDLRDRGIRELVFIGQDLGSYGKDGGEQALPGLLARVSTLAGDFRIRVLYIHPDNFPSGILPIMASDRRILPYFDLPFQHASEPILRAMNRRGNAAKYLELIASIRSALPDAMIRSTFLIGFPGENDRDFAALRDFQEKAQLDWLGSFAYSLEEGTAAYSMRGKVPKKVVASRRAAIEEAQERITRARLERFVGRDLDILVEETVVRASEDDEELSLGRAWFQAPEVDGLTVLRGNFSPGQLVRARVLAVTGVDLDARPLD